MPKRKKADIPGENIPQETNPANDQLRKRMRKHRADPKDKITDEDIRNVKVETASPLPIPVAANAPETTDANDIMDEEAASPLPVPENITKVKPGDLVDDKEDSDKKAGKKHTTPWDIMSED